MRTLLIQFALALATLISSVVEAGDAGIDPALLTLYQLIDERLAIMEDVARYKYHQGIPVEDLQREAVIIEQTVQTATRQGLDPAASQRFFAAQIHAAKEIQTYWFEQWRSGESDFGAQVLDLVADLRPRLNLLGEQIMAQMALIQGIAADTGASQFSAALNTVGLSDATKQVLFNSLKLALAHRTTQVNTLERIKATGKLRVGTTGDYRPFSYRLDGKLAGIDIDFARRLAADLAVPVEFIDTSWPTLMDDLAADRFDLGMSGISWSTARNRDAFFTSAYYQGGKSAIARCTEVSRFASPSAIDQPGVRLIVNPGGTNQQYVTGQISHADVRVYDNNVTIFDEIVHGHADLMITDAIEVKLQSKLHPELCQALNGELLTYLEKAWLLPRDLDFKQYLDAWLYRFKQDGEFQAIFARHLGTPDMLP